jgi:hypothetical protein
VTARAGPLFSVWGTCGVLFVGDYFGTPQLYDGGTWQQTPSGTTGALVDIWGSGPDDIYVAGNDLVHFDGKQWSKVALGANTFVREVWGSGPKDVFAAGAKDVCKLCTSKLQIWHWEGATWTAMLSGTDPGQYWGVWGAGPKDVYAAAGPSTHHYACP